MFVNFWEHKCFKWTLLSLSFRERDSAYLFRSRATSLFSFKIDVQKNLINTFVPKRWKMSLLKLVNCAHKTFHDCINCEWICYRICNETKKTYLHYWQHYITSVELNSTPCSKMDLGLLQHPRWSTLYTKHSILDVAVVLDPPLILVSLPHSQAHCFSVHFLWIILGQIYLLLRSNKRGLYL